MGKSCLVVRFVRDEFFEYQEPTIGGEGGGRAQRNTPAPIGYELCRRCSRASGGVLRAPMLWPCCLSLLLGGTGQGNGFRPQNSNVAPSVRSLFVARHLNEAHECSTTRIRYSFRQNEIRGWFNTRVRRSQNGVFLALAWGVRVGGLEGSGAVLHPKNTLKGGHRFSAPGIGQVPFVNKHPLLPSNVIGWRSQKQVPVTRRTRQFRAISCCQGVAKRLRNAKHPHTNAIRFRLGREQ